MMKYKTVGLLAVSAMLVTAFFLHNSDLTRDQRHYQHLEAQPKAACTDHGRDVFCTHLPLLSIDTSEPIYPPHYYNTSDEIIIKENGRPAFRDTFVSAIVKLFDSPLENNHLTDEPVLVEHALTRIRGNSSRRFNKKSYLLKFKEENLVDNKDVPLAGMVADHSWCLHGPYMDRTLIRNYICCHLAGEIMEYAPDVRFCELFVNGEYMGVYLIMEKINYNEAGRIKLTATNPKMVDTSYILKLDAGEADPMHTLQTFCDYSGKRGVSSRTREKFEIIYPSSTLTDLQKKNMIYQISAFEKSLMSFDFEDEKKGYAAYIDVDSFVDYMVLNEFTMNVDSGLLSTYFCKDVRGKIKIIGWDYNNTFNNFRANLNDPRTFYLNDTWYAALLRDTNFVDKVVDRYRSLRQSILSDEYLYKLVDDTIAYLGPAIDRNYEKWGDCFELDFEHASSDQNAAYALLKPYDRNKRSYEEYVEDLKRNIHEQGVFLDKNITTLYSRSHDSTNKQFKLEEGHK